MPRHRNPFDKGDLYIQFEIRMPEPNFIETEKLKVNIFYMYVLIKKTSFYFIYYKFLYFSSPLK